MKNIDIVYDILVAAKVEYVIALPDSLLGILCKRIQSGNSIEYIQATHEADCVGISTGLSLCGKRSLVVMENSGLRTACEIIARFHLSHNLFSCYLLSHRGAFGERNWWGQAHDLTLLPLLDTLRFKWTSLYSISDLGDLLEKAYSSLNSGQSSSLLCAEPSFLKEIQQ